MTEIVPTRELENLIRNETRPVLIDVFAEWCPPCKALAPLIDKMSAELKDQVRIVKMDSDDSHAGDPAIPNPLANFMAATGTRTIPTLALFENGQFLDIYRGNNRTQAAITAWMEKTLGRKLNEPSVAPPLHDYAIIFNNVAGTPEEKMASISKFFNQEASPELARVFLAQRARIVGASEDADGSGDIGLIFRTTDDVAKQIAKIIPDKKIIGVSAPPQPLP
ncbi:MAG TPA: thioredoxin domain-containing protein [Patescibacteria group bacterium]|nr:thioredoxin domain-containing protein [Patescibacteria group bacterium]